VLTTGSKPGIHASVLRADGSHAGMLSVPGNVCGGAVVGSPFLQMNGQAVFKFAVKVLDESARETVAAAGMQLSEIDCLIPHQANVRILDATARKLGVPSEKLVVTVDHHGNTSAASVPLALDEYVRAGRIRPGHRVLLQGVGGGFTWGSSVVTL
jgi:3-oxoacyl-[acyl-carrier-protein] synthase-3